MNDYIYVKRCEFCGGVFCFEDLEYEDMDGEPNEPCVCGDFEKDYENEETNPNS